MIGPLPAGMAGISPSKEVSMNDRKKRILIVDDDPEQLYLGREFLTREGYEVLTHQSPFGVAGLVQAAEPDLLLLDVNMPVLRGDDLAAALKADDRTRNLPVVLYSSFDETQLRSAMVRLHLDGYIRKGDFTELRRKVDYFLRSHETNAETYRRDLYAVQ